MNGTRRATIALGLALLGGALSAQSVRGVVVQPDSSTRAAGVIVAAADAQGAVVARALTGDDGGFDMRVPAAGRYSIRLLRIGYRPTLIADVNVPASGVEALRIVLGGEAVVLSAVTVRSDNVCGSTEDAGRVVAQLWEDARTALTATELSVGARALDVEWQAFQFMMDPGAKRAQDQWVLRRRGRTERPFVALSPDSLARAGYVINEGTTLSYNAPDAAGLLSDQFASTHCFRVDPPSRTRPQWIGVAFTPTPARGAMREIRGTLWLDRATSELRLLEFRYTNLPPEADDPMIGGFIEYARMPTGQWLVARWAIRTPRMVVRNIGGGGVPGGGRDVRNVLASVGVTGGELVTVRRGVDSLYRADPTILAAEGSAKTVAAQPSACGAAMRPGAMIAGTVLHASRPVAGAVVSVTWSGAAPHQATLSTVADARGGFSLPCVPRGVPLTVMASHGDEKTQPMSVPAVTRAAALVDIDFSPIPARRP